MDYQVLRDPIHVDHSGISFSMCITPIIIQIEYTHIVLFPRTIFSCDNFSKRKSNVNIWNFPTYVRKYVLICKYDIIFSLSMTLQRHILWTLIIFSRLFFTLTYLRSFIILNVRTYVLRAVLIYHKNSIRYF